MFVFLSFDDSEWDDRKWRFWWVKFPGEDFFAPKTGDEKGGGVGERSQQTFFIYRENALNRVEKLEFQYLIWQMSLCARDLHLKCNKSFQFGDNRLPLIEINQVSNDSLN